MIEENTIHSLTITPAWKGRGSTAPHTENVGIKKSGHKIIIIIVTIIPQFPQSIFLVKPTNLAI